MPEITPDRIKAFLDDLALISAKHSLIVDGYFGEYGIHKMPAGFLDYSCDADGCDLAGSDSHDFASLGAIRSLDVSTATAHQRIALSKSLADTRRLVEER